MKSHLYIGIDDTDIPDSRGTGQLARDLARFLEEAGLARIHSVSRHQLLLDPEIPFTSHNSSACIKGILTTNEFRIRDFCSDFLLVHSAEGSDAGLCIALEENVTQAVVSFGKQAKTIILNKEQAYEVALSCEIILTGLTGQKIGVIGALAAVGLRFEGNDGRLLWMNHLREVQGVFSVKRYKEIVPVDEITDLDGSILPPDTRLKILEWCRPVVRNKKIVLFAEKSDDHANYQYQSASKEYIKYISE